MTAKPTGCPFSPTRRGLLTGAAALAASLPAFAPAPAGAQARAVAAAPVAGEASGGDFVSPYGPHQAGIVTPRPANGIVAAFHVLADTPADLQDLFRRLGERIVFLTHGGPVPVLEAGLPPADSGILGPVIRPDATTITLALGHSLFADRPWLAPLQPRVLQRMTRFPNDALDADICHGDLAIQFCAHTQDACVHALRDIVKAIPDRLVLKWAQAGNVPVIEPLPSGQVQSARNLLGFRDGSANPDSGDAAAMDRVVWASDEPEWARGGSYMAVRLIRNLVERWDRTPLAEQERIMGRFKQTGAPLDNAGASEFVPPDYAADAGGSLTAVDSHIRLANPRDAATAASIILRRPFNYVNGVLKNGQLDQGLLFIAWQADLEQGFIAVQRRLDGEPLEEYIKPVGGGYFFALPGFAEGEYPGQALIAAI